MQKLILASSSKYRARLLARWYDSFEQVSPDIDESVLAGESPQDYVARLSLEKAQKIAINEPDAWVIGSDQAATLNNTIIGKSHNKANALKQLKQSSGQIVTFYTGVALLNQANNFSQTQVVVTQVKFKTLTQDMIERYLELDKPYDCAGSFKVESYGALLFESVTSDDPDALEGLPMIALGKMLQAARIDPLLK